MLSFNLFPGGRRFAITMSYDDGSRHDARLVDIFDRHGVKGAFHLNSGLLAANDGSAGGCVRATDVRELYKNQEISCHTLTHPWPCEITKDRLAFETLQDRANLEKRSGRVVRGMSYPFGQYDREVAETMRACGIAYSRTTAASGGFGVPQNFMEWSPSCHHRDAPALAEKFLQLVNEDDGRRLRDWKLFYVWGHSFEFDRDNNWELIEELCARVGGNDKIWHATNIEICDYVAAARAMRSSVDGSLAYNPSAVSVWASSGGADGRAVEIKAGETISA